MQTASPAVRRWPWLLLAGLVLLVWGHTVTFQFVWDDQYFIEELKSIRSLASVPEMFYRLDAQSSYPEGFVLFRPLRTVHYAVLFALGGGDAPKPWLFHAANIVWHGAASILLFQVLLTALRHRRATESSDSATWIAFLCAAAFAVHPVASEVVCWAKSLDDLMATTFLLASCLALLRWRPDETSKRTYIWAVVFFALAVYSKESATPFALFCIPLLVWCTRYPLRSVLRFSAPFLAVALLFMVHRHLVIGRTSQTAPLSGTHAQTLIDTLPSAQIYTRLLAGIPPFCIDYSYMTSNHPLTAPTVVVGFVIVAALTGLSLLALRRHTALLGGGFLWILVFMLPFSNLVPMMQYCAERFLYLPLVGGALALAAALTLIRQTKPALLFSTVIIVVWAAIAWNRSWIWNDRVTLFVRSHIEGPTSERVQDNAIAAAMGQPHMRAVFARVKRPGETGRPVVSAIAPNQPVDWNSVNGTLEQLHALLPTNATVSSALAIAKALQGKPSEAIPYFQLAAQQSPKDATLWKNLGQAYASAGKPAEADEAYRRANELHHP